MTGVDEQNSFVNYNLGASWQVNPGWTLRSAVIKNIVGDGKRRLQRPISAGFPLMALNSDELLTTTDESSFHLEHKTFYAGIDFKAKGYPIFSGIEYSKDRGETFSFDTTASFNHLISKQESHNIQAYFETLLTRNLSLGASCSYSDVTVNAPSNNYSGIRKRGQATLSYFFPHGLSLRLQGVVETSHVQFTSKKEAFLPQINWYLFDNTLRLNIKGKLEKNSMAGTSDRVDEVSFNFYCYY